MAITLGTDGYCTVAHVQSLNGQRSYDANSIPSSTTVEDFITDVFNEINGVLSALGYTVPVATTYAVASRILRTVNQYGACAKAERATHSVGLDGESERANELQAEYERLLDLLRDGGLSLVDAERGDDSPKQVNEKTPEGSFNLDSNGDERDSDYTRMMDF